MRVIPADDGLQFMFLAVSSKDPHIYKLNTQTSLFHKVHYFSIRKAAVNCESSKFLVYHQFSSVCVVACGARTRKSPKIPITSIKGAEIFGLGS